MARNFIDSCGILVRHLVRVAMGMTTNTVRPAGQAAPTLKEGNEFATVKILTAPLIDMSFARTYADQTYTTWSASTPYAVGAQVAYQGHSYICIVVVTGGTGPAADTAHWSQTTAPTKVIETIDGAYTFVASVQFYRHSDPVRDGAGLSGFGMGAFDKAARIEAILALSPNVELMDSLGLYLADVGTPTNVGALVDGAIWDDRGSIDLTFIVSNTETALIESIATAEIDLWFQGQAGVDHKTIEVQS
jgi:hypothetical protein